MKQKDNKKNYNKEFFMERVKEYGELRNLNYQIEEIEDIFLENYGIKDVSTFRKCWDIIKNTGQVNITVDSNLGLMKLARARNKLLVDRKINIQANNELHKEANSKARWLGVIESIKAFNFTQYKLKEAPKNTVSKGLKDVIYVIGDIHYRGMIDKELVINTFQIIKNEIEQNEYENVDIWFTGDLTDGEIKEGQQRYNEPVIKCACQVANIIIECINQISNVKNVKLVYGNHEEIRLWGEKNTENNIAEFIGQMLKIGLRKNISFEHGVELWFKYKNKDILLTHGHFAYCKNKSRLVEHCDTIYGKQPHIIVLGHFHSAKTTQFSRNRWLIVAPAVKDWQSNWDKSNSYCGFGQIDRLKLNMESPQITTVNVVEKLR